MTTPTKVLIVDDSRIFRGAVEQSLANTEDIEVIGSVRNGIKALEFITQNRPDIITLDVEMPEMDGLTTLLEIQKFNALPSPAPPIGVIMLSAHTQRGATTTIKALQEGAFDFITKPDSQDAAENIETLRRQLLMKIRYFASRRILSPKPQAAPLKPVASSPIKPTPDIIKGLQQSKIKAIVIGISTGGPKALISMLPALCAKVEVPIFIVQHMPKTFTQSLAESLDAKCLYTVKEASDNDIVEPRHVYIAPGGRHMLLRQQNGQIVTVINDQPPERGCRPSANILFRSATTVYANECIVVIMTGMGDDGTNGATALKRKGAYIIVQDEESSVVWGMPGSAVEAGIADEVVPLTEIPDRILTLTAR